MTYKPIPKKEIEQIIKKIKNYQDNIDSFYKSAKNFDGKKAIKENGFLMEKEIFENLKKTLFYNDLINKTHKEPLSEKIKKKFKDAQVVNIKICEPKLFKDYKELENDLKNKNEYIIVDYNIFYIISNKKIDEGKGKILYEINREYLILFLNGNEKVYFRHNSNIINDENLLEEQNEEGNIDIIDITEEEKPIEKIEQIKIIKNKSLLQTINKGENKKKVYEKQFMLALEFFLFSQEIQAKIDESNEAKVQPPYYSECYLIKKYLMTEQLNTNLCSTIYQYLLKNKEKYISKKKEDIVEDLIKIFESQFKDINNKEITILNDKKQFEVEFKLNYDKTEVIFINRYIIINKDILNNIISDNFDPNLINPLKLLINKNKVIIQYEEKNVIFIGKSDKNIFKYYFPEIIIKYDEIEQMKNQFDKFKNFDYSCFEKQLNPNKLKKIDVLIDKEKNKKIGKIYMIDTKKYENLKDYKTNILTNLRKNDEELKLMKQEKYYIINNKYIKKLKELFNFEQFLNLYQEKINKKEKDINKIITQNKQIFSIEKNVIRKELENGEFIHLKRKDLDEINSFYFFEFDIISVKLKECLVDNDLFPKNLELLEIKCKIKEEKIIISPNFADKFIVFICSKNDANEFIPEILYEFKDKSSLHNFFDENINPKLLLKDKMKEIYINSQKNLGIIAYKIIELDKNEIPVKEEVNEDIYNLIKIYLYYKDLFNNISLSKTEINGNENNLHKCFLINKEYMDSYKKHYLYSKLGNKLDEYIEKNNIIQKDLKGNLYSQENIDIIYDYLQKNNILNDFNDLGVYTLDQNLIKINKKQVAGENLYYYDDFVIVNEEIYKYFFYSLNINDNEKEYIINSGKIIIFFKKEFFQVLVGKVSSDCIKFYLLINL